MVGARMKSRARFEPLTEEDQDAWFDWQLNLHRSRNLWAALANLSFAADRRDAELFWGWEYAKAACIAADGSTAYLAVRWATLRAVLAAPEVS